MTAAVAVFSITAGEGRDHPQGRRLDLSTGWPSSLADALNGLPPAVDAWWSAGTFAGDYRAGARFEASCCCPVDVDYHDEHGRHVEAPAAWHQAVEQLIAAGELPGAIYHRTPRGFRLLFPFDEPVTDPAAARQAGVGAGALVTDVLERFGLACVRGAAGAAVDGKVSVDVARFLFGPRAIVDGAARDATAQLISATTWPAEVLGELAPEGWRETRGEGGGVATAAAELSPAARAQIESLLHAVSPACDYETWISVGQAIHSECPGEQGFELWDRWSQGAPDSYAKAKPRRHWRSFRTGGGITLGWLRMHAQTRYGWQPAVPECIREFVAGGGGTARAPARNAAEAAARGERWGPLHELLAPQDYELHSVDELLDLQPQPYLVRGLLRRTQAAMLYGPPGGGKTLLGVDLAAHVALGKPWRSMPVRQGPVVYLALEGRAGLRSRLLAWCDGDSSAARRLSGLITIGWSSFDLHRRQDVDALLRAVEALPQRPVLIVIDTLSRALPGAEENSARDMSGVIRHVDELRARTAACILLIHHSGKGESAKERGSGALRGGMDAMLEIKATRDKASGAKVFTLQADRLRDDPELEPISWEGVEVRIGTDEDGEPVHGVRLRPSAAPRRAAKVENATQGRARSLVIQQLARLDEPESANNLARLVAREHKVGEGRVKEAFATLVRDSWIAKEKRGKSVFYSLNRDAIEVLSYESPRVPTSTHESPGPIALIRQSTSTQSPRSHPLKGGTLGTRPTTEGEALDRCPWCARGDFFQVEGEGMFCLTCNPALPRTETLPVMRFGPSADQPEPERERKDLA